MEVDGEFEESGESVVHCKSLYGPTPMKASSAVPFDIEAYLRQKSQLVNQALKGYMGQFPPERQTLFRALHYGLFPGGKRIRPILTLAAGELFGGQTKVLLPFACAVEMIHGYSLIHDDLPALDNDDLRRGRPTVHKVFGEGMALLAGDALLTEAFHVLSAPNLCERLSAAQVLAALHELAAAAGAFGLVGGQALDLEAENRSVDLDRVELIHEKKTAALILVSVRVGALIAGADDDGLGRICRYGKDLGMAFQIADDILDAQGETAAGEGAESARRELGKATFPAVAGIGSSKERLGELLTSCKVALEPFGPRAVPLWAIAAHVAERAMGSHAGKYVEGDLKNL